MRGSFSPFQFQPARALCPELRARGGTLADWRARAGVGESPENTGSSPSDTLPRPDASTQPTGGAPAPSWGAGQGGARVQVAHRLPSGLLGHHPPLPPGGGWGPVSTWGRTQAWAPAAQPPASGFRGAHFPPFLVRIPNRNLSAFDSALENAEARQAALLLGCDLALRGPGVTHRPFPDVSASRRGRPARPAPAHALPPPPPGPTAPRPTLRLRQVVGVLTPGAPPAPCDP